MEVVLTFLSGTSRGAITTIIKYGGGHKDGARDEPKLQHTL